MREAEFLVLWGNGHRARVGGGGAHVNPFGHHLAQAVQETRWFHGVLLKNSVLPKQQACGWVCSLRHPSSSLPQILGWWLISQKAPRQPGPIPDLAQYLPSHSPQILGRESLFSQIGHQRLLKYRRFLNLQNLPSHRTKHQQLPSPLAPAETLHPASSLNLLAHFSTGPHPGLRRLRLRLERSGDAVLPAPEWLSRCSVFAGALD